MLPPFIIEQIRERENKERIRHEQPRLELPLNRRPPPPRRSQEDEDDANRGVIIIELG